MAIVGRAKYKRARAKIRGDATRIFGAPFASRLFELSRSRVCVLPAPQSQSPKLETTRSLDKHPLFGLITVKTALIPSADLSPICSLSPETKMSVS